MNLFKKKNILSAVITVALSAALLSGCGQKAEPPAPTATPDTGAQTEPVRVGLAWLADFENGEVDEDTQAYIDAVTAAGGEPVLLAQVTNLEEAKEQLATVDALIMTGGEDIDPSYYGEEPNEYLEETNPARDTSDYWMLTAAMEEDFPTLATCRGMQMMNTVCGGTLYQDIPTMYDTDLQHRDPELVDFTYHDITIDPNSLIYSIMGTDTLNVNSWHHQGIHTVGDGLTEIAWATDGIVEGLQMTDKTFMLGVQFHPEWMVVEGDNSYLPFFTALMDASNA